MAHSLSEAFLAHINQNIGIAHKISRLNFEDAGEREDVLQEMMYQLWRSYPGFDGRSRFSTWMYKVCLNTALTCRRKSNKKKEESLSSAHQQIPNEASTNEEEAVRLLHDAIGTLSPVNKAIVILYLENTSYEEIAAIVGLTRSNVSVRLVRIKKELEEKLNQKLKSINDVNF